MLQLPGFRFFCADIILRTLLHELQAFSYGYATSGLV